MLSGTIAADRTLSHICSSGLTMSLKSAAELNSYAEILAMSAEYVAASISSRAYDKIIPQTVLVQCDGVRFDAGQFG